jgi:predicted hydrocarbon binding protein
MRRSVAAATRATARRPREREKEGKLLVIGVPWLTFTSARKLLNVVSKLDPRRANMATVITISGADKTGALARLYSFFARKGYGVRGHHMTDSGAGKLLSISIDGARIDSQALSAEIEELSADYTVVGCAAEGAETAAANEKAQPDASALKEIAARFPEIAPLVHAYAEGFDYENRDQELFAAGRKLGAHHYKKEWSLGAPLKMPVALRRTLVPALEKICEIEASDHEVVLKDSPFCGGRDRLRCCCEFVTGFMQGFLDAGPGTKDSRVQKTTCKANGGPHSVYAVKYAA